jgi:hypothetical protein
LNSQEKVQLSRDIQDCYTDEPELSGFCGNEVVAPNGAFGISDETM